MRGLFVAALWLLCLAGTAHAALSGNEQVALAGKGAFEELANGLQAQAAVGPMKVADWHALCYANHRLKRYDRTETCLDALEAALKGRDKRTRLFGLDDATPALHILRAETALELGQWDAAVKSAQRALDWFRDEGDNERDIQVQALAVQAIALSNLGLTRQANALLVQLRKVPANVLGDETISAKSLAQARVSMALGYWQEVLDALALDKTLALRKFLDNLVTGAFLRNENNWVWVELPRAYMENKALLELGERERAKQGFEAMLAVEQIAANGEIAWMALTDYARILEAEGAFDAAIQAYRKALGFIEAQRSSINTEANKIGFVGDKQTVYARLVNLLFVQGRFGEAFEVMERGKSRALVDMLASKQRFAAPLTDRADAKQVEAALAEVVKADTAQREQTINRVRSMGRTQQVALVERLPTELRELVSVRALKPNEIQALLAPDEALLSYFAHEGQLFVVAVQQSGITAQKIDTQDLERDIRRLRTLISQQLEVQDLLQSLYQRLVAPVEAQLTRPRLTIVAHGALHYLPFNALLRGNQYLADRYAIRTLPSASVLQFLKPRNNTRTASSLVVGNPDLNNPAMDLPGAEAEARAVAQLLDTPQLLVRQQATKAAFTRLAPDARFVHVASHGEFNDTQPLASGLLLSGPNTPSSRLTVADLYDLGLDAELVTLSACETGLGAVGSGDDVVGLTRGLLYAGARSVVTSLWKVDDDATQQLMTQMYQNLRTQTMDEALRAAQAHTRQSHPHPYYWAAFYLTGVR